MPPQPHHHAPGSINDLIGLVACLFPGPFAGQGFFHSPLFSRFQVVRVFLDFLDDIFLLDLTLEAPQRVFEGFSLLKSHFSQTSNTPIPCIAIWAHSKQQLLGFSPIPLGQVKSIFGGPATDAGGERGRERFFLARISGILIRTRVRRFTNWQEDG